MKILLPVDGSSFGLRAARYVARHLSQFGRGTAITLVYVDPPALQWAGSQVSPDDVDRFHDKNAEKALRGARNVFARARIACREERLVGDAGASIARLARQGRFDLIVMGSHGRGAMKALLIGSVVSRTLALTRVPVLVVR